VREREREKSISPIYGYIVQMRKETSGNRFCLRARRPGPPQTPYGVLRSLRDMVSVSLSFSLSLSLSVFLMALGETDQNRSVLRDDEPNAIYAVDRVVAAGTALCFQRRRYKPRGVSAKITSNVC